MNVISTDKMNCVLDSINSLRTDLAQWKSEVQSEIEFLGNICWSLEDDLKKLKQTEPTRTLPDNRPILVSTPANKFPIQNMENLQAFEQEIADANAFQKYVQYFTNQLRTVRQAKSVYKRRLHLRECLLSE